MHRLGWHRSGPVQVHWTMVLEFMIYCSQVSFCKPDLFIKKKRDRSLEPHLSKIKLKNPNQIFDQKKIEPNPKTQNSPCAARFFNRRINSKHFKNKIQNLYVSTWVHATMHGSKPQCFSSIKNKFWLTLSNNESWFLEIWICIKRRDKNIFDICYRVTWGSYQRKG